MDGSLALIFFHEFYGNGTAEAAPALIETGPCAAFVGAHLLALDMYEHCYHIDFGAKAASYVDTFMQAIAWKNMDRLLSEIHHGGQPSTANKGAPDA